MINSVYVENLCNVVLPVSIENTEKLAQKFIDYVYANYLSENFPENCDYTAEITLCDNNFIHKINKEYRNIDAPTDVITFALFADSEDKIITDNTVSLGQILISVERTIEQAQENNNTAQEEFLFLLAHGVLHLFGFDHPTDEDLEKMLKIQDEMIESIDYVKIQS